jgi:hypothetical protein
MAAISTKPLPASPPSSRKQPTTTNYNAASTPSPTKTERNPYKNKNKTQPPTKINNKTELKCTQTKSSSSAKTSSMNKASSNKYKLQKKYMTVSSNKSQLPSSINSQSPSPPHLPLPNYHPSPPKHRSPSRNRPTPTTTGRTDPTAEKTTIAATIGEETIEVSIGERGEERATDADTMMERGRPTNPSMSRRTNPETTEKPETTETTGKDQ